MGNRGGRITSREWENEVDLRSWEPLPPPSSSTDITLAQLSSMATGFKSADSASIRKLQSFSHVLLAKDCRVPVRGFPWVSGPNFGLVGELGRLCVKSVLPRPRNFQKPPERYDSICFSLHVCNSCAVVGAAQMAPVLAPLRCRVTIFSGLILGDPP